MVTTDAAGMQLSIVQYVLRTISNVIKYPVIIILIILIAFSVFSIGWIIVEAATEKRHMTASLPRLIEKMRRGDKSLVTCINESGLLARQKTLLKELLSHPDFNKEMTLELSDNLYEKEESHYDFILKLTQTVSKIGPMMGLLGTLIPLGPGIIALGQGDTYTLSESMLTAFDTTIAGLVAAAVCLVISTIRKRWYDGYMSDLDTLINCVIELKFEYGAETGKIESEEDEDSNANAVTSAGSAASSDKQN